MSTQEEELAGGNVAKVVRIGDTVRRSTGPWTPTIHRLLAHVRAKGPLWVPEPFGLDEAGREVLSYIAGEVPHEMPGWVWSEQALTDVAGALRAWHDATIDFDFCSPGSRIWDLAYTAYRFVPLMPGPDAMDGVNTRERSPFESPVMAERLDSFLSAYGAAGVEARYGIPDLIRTTIDRLHAIAAWTEDHVRNSGSVALADHAAMYRDHARWLRSWIGSGKAP